MESLYYKHSGKFSGGALAYGLVCGTLVGLITAWVYAYIDLYSPLGGVVSAVVAAIFGVIVGATTSNFLNKKLVRNPAVGMAAVTLATAVSYYVSWVVWLVALLHRGGMTDPELSVGSLAVHPRDVWQIVGMVNHAGAWKYRDSTPTGWELWAVWAMEAAIVFGASLAFAWTNMHDTPFCEQCVQWTKKKADIARVVPTELVHFKQDLENKNFAAVEKLGPAPDYSVDFHRLDMYSCEKCSMFDVLDAVRVRRVKQRGKTQEKTSNTVRWLLLSSSEAGALRKMAQRMEQVENQRDGETAQAASTP